MPLQDFLLQAQKGNYLREWLRCMAVYGAGMHPSLILLPSSCEDNQRHHRLLQREENVEELHRRVRAVMASIGRYNYEHIFIDNASQDRTVEILKRLAAADTNVKVIVNSRNFGHIRSPMHAFTQAQGDAVIVIVADMQDPREMIADLIQGWEEGYSMVLCLKHASEEHSLMFWLRKRYYATVNRLSSIETFQNFTGFGLYDRRVVDLVKSFRDPYPYFRGMIAEIGLPHKELYYNQPARQRQPVWPSSQCWHPTARRIPIDDYGAVTTVATANPASAVALHAGTSLQVPEFDRQLSWFSGSWPLPAPRASGR